MTREYKVGMTGKTTSGYWWEIYHDDQSTEFPLKLSIGEGDERQSGWMSRDGVFMTPFDIDVGDLIHPDDAKEETPTDGITFSGDRTIIRVTEGEAIAGLSDERVAEIKAALSGVSAVDLAPLSGRIDPLRFQAYCAAMQGILANPAALTIYRRHPDSADRTFEVWLSDVSLINADLAIARLSEKEG